jgi:hypothetical protein
VERISEQYLLPVLEAMLHQFPFRIMGFHSDNGSEFVNHKVAEMLDGLLIGFTKSRANRRQGQRFGGGKNGAVIRKHVGYGHVAAPHAEAVQKFYTAHFNPNLNYHRGRAGLRPRASTPAENGRAVTRPTITRRRTKS